MSGDDSDNARANLQPLCKPCHSRKTATEQGGFGNKVRAIALVLFTVPLDPGSALVCSVLEQPDAVSYTDSATLIVEAQTCKADRIMRSGFEE